MVCGALKRSLDLKDGSGVTFISDMQKWRRGEMKKLMWWCAWSTYDEEFKDQLNKLGKLDADAAKDLISKPHRAWCRAYFDTQCKNIMIDNNFTEFFNA
ncbi:hypothetical protein KY285_030721 [Solanum tuberosum]|nr:hypothetical protein KY285_030721 [Solanum tuberosum]